MSLITTGIDIGTHSIKIVVAEQTIVNGRPVPKVLSTGLAECKGLRHGYIINSEEVQRSLVEAKQQVERSTGLKIDQCRIAAGGVGMSSIVASGKISVARPDAEITDQDIQALHTTAEKQIPTSLSQNRKIIHTIPLEYKLDGQAVLGDPISLKGSNLEVVILFITILEHHLTNFLEIVENLDIKVADVIASPIASSLVALSKTQKVAGGVLVNIGAETTSLAVFENDIPVSVEMLPIGGTDITNDIALGLQIPLDEAEQIKLGELTHPDLPTKEINQIIDRRLKEIFDSINDHLKKIKRQELLPAGIIITGGSSRLDGIEEKARSILKLPASLARLQGGYRKYGVADSSWSVAYGLCLIGLSEDRQRSGRRISGRFSNWPAKLTQWFKQFLP